MPREIAFHGVYMPSMTLMFFIAAGLAWGFDRLISGYDLYRFFWHPALLRLSLFACLLAPWRSLFTVETDPMKKFFSLLATLLVLALAIWIGRTLWEHYMNTPWTRDGRVRADIINVAADVNGYVVGVPVKDNQLVKKGDVLLEIDPEHYQIMVKQAQSLVASRKATWEMRKVNAHRRADMDSMVISRENRDDASNIADSALADYQHALAQLDAAQLDLKRTKVLATVDGYVTNLNVHRGDYARVGDPKMAVIDMDSFWVYGFFEETKLPHIRVGDKADLQMMSGEVLKGHVESISRGIYDRDNPESRELVADVNPTFNWVRLAQRVPVRIHIDEIPDGFLLAAGTTCTVIVQQDAAAQ